MDETTQPVSAYKYSTCECRRTYFTKVLKVSPLFFFFLEKWGTGESNNGTMLYYLDKSGKQYMHSNEKKHFQGKIGVVKQEKGKNPIDNQKDGASKTE